MTIYTKVILLVMFIIGAHLPHDVCLYNDVYDKSEDDDIKPDSMTLGSIKATRPIFQASWNDSI